MYGCDYHSCRSNTLRNSHTKTHKNPRRAALVPVHVDLFIVGEEFPVGFIRQVLTDIEKTRLYKILSESLSAQVHEFHPVIRNIGTYYLLVAPTS